MLKTSTRRLGSRAGLALILQILFAPTISMGQSFVNWETPHVHPLDMTPDGQKLIAVNTADNRLEVFDISSGAPRPIGSIPVGLDPVTVRARSNTEAWVVSQISDSINIVDLATLNVAQSLRTDDEPADVVFAFNVNRAFVSCSQTNSILVYDLADLSLAPQRISVLGEEPRAMAYDPARNEIYVAIFESGNKSTILGGGSTINNGFPPNVVSDPSGPYGGLNPPPNDGGAFKPLMNPGNPAPPRVGLIVKKDPLGRWMDDNLHDWTSMVSGIDAAKSGRPVGWDLYDHDVAIINTSTLGVSYARGLMNICMSLSVNPGDGEVCVVGTDATNEVRFEPVLNGRFLRVNLARFNPANPASVSVSDLNSHLTYGTTVPFEPATYGERIKSIGDPRAMVWNADGTRGYVAGMGSNNVVMIDGSGNRQDAPGEPGRVTIDVGAGPTGLVFDGPRNRLYVLNKFDGSISTVDMATELESTRVTFHDPTPAPIKIGRRHLYDTHLNSGLGQVSCASCHVDARNDRLAWDLGNPAGDMKTFNQNCTLLENCEDWHPMKGPMTTQTLQDIIGHEPHHWRADRTGIEEFADAFRDLLGRDDPLPSQPPFDEMQEFEDFLATIHFPPNPYRNFDNSLPTSLPLPGHFTTGRFSPAGQPLPNGNAVAGLSAYRTANLDGVQCVTCHALPSGGGTDSMLVGLNFVPIPPGPDGEHHALVVSVDGSTNVSIKVPQLRNMYDKVGFETTQLNNVSGFGFLHDGSVDSIARFVNEPLFSVSSDQMTANLVALMLSFSGSQFGNALPLEPPGLPSQDSHAAVGWQTTLVNAATAPPSQLQLIANMITQADTNRVGLVVKGLVGGVRRGWRYNGGNLFQSDRAGETVSAVSLRALAIAGGELTYTVVPKGTETRIGIDRDEDGYFDRDEVELCSNPADPLSVPGSPGTDIDADGDEDDADILAFVDALLGRAAAPHHTIRSDLNCDGEANAMDLAVFVNARLAP